jgi:protease I
MPPRVFDWHDDPAGTFLAAPQIRARFAYYEPGKGYRNYHTHEEAGPTGAWETWVVLEGEVAFDFDGTEVIVKPGQAVTAAPHEKHRDRCASDTPAVAFLCVTPHTPPTHTQYDEDGTRRPARAGVSSAAWKGEAPLGQEQSAPIFAAWEAKNHANGNGASNDSAALSLSEHQRQLSAADRRGELITQAERNGTPYPEQPKGKVLLVIGDAAETTDTLYPWMRMMEAGYDCVVAAPEVREYQLVNHERPAGWHITRETPGYMFKADVAFKDVKPAEYAGILLSGGRAPEYIRYDKDLNDMVRWFVNAGLPVGSVCHGIEILATADVIRGKRVTCVPKCQFDAEVVGATYVAAPVVVDGNIVTARGARDGWLWMREFLKLLEPAGSPPPGGASPPPAAHAPAAGAATRPG